MQKRQLLSIGQASEYLGVSIDTLRRWEEKRRIEPFRSPGGHRYFNKEDLDKLFGKRYTRDEKTKRRKKSEIEKAVSQKPKEEKEVQITYELKKEEFIILDRPVRDFKVPDSKPVKIIQEKPLLSPYEAYIKQQSASILTPPVVNEPQERQKKEEAVKKQPKLSKQTKILIFCGFFVLLITAFLLIAWWSSSQEILSPVP